MEKRLKPYRQLILVVILAFAFLTRVWRIYIPEKYYFDEVYHAVTAKLIAGNDPRAFEWWNPPPESNTAVDWLHPPVAKYTQAFFILLFGENSLGWRFSSAVFGVGVIYLVYRLALELFDKYSVSLLAALIASLDGLLLTQSRIAMNDIHVTFFILLAMSFYWKFFNLSRRPKYSSKNFRFLFMASLAAGLALASKWSGLFVVSLIIGWEILRIGFVADRFFSIAKEFHQRKARYLINLKKSLALFPFLIMTPMAIYLGSYWLMFAQGKDFQHFKDLHWQIYQYQTHLQATHPYQSRPWQWFLDLKPVWFYVDYIDSQTIANIYAFGNPAIFWLGDLAVIAAIIFILFQSYSWIKQQLTAAHQKELLAILFLTLGYLIVWTPWVFSPRIMFFYHYTPAVPLLSIMLAWWLIKLQPWEIKVTGGRLKVGNIMLSLAMTSIMTCFVIWFPQWTALPVNKEFADHVFYLLKSWK